MPEEDDCMTEIITPVVPTVKQPTSVVNSVQAEPSVPPPQPKKKFFTSKKRKMEPAAVDQVAEQEITPNTAASADEAAEAAAPPPPKVPPLKLRIKNVLPPPPPPGKLITGFFGKSLKLLGKFSATCLFLHLNFFKHANQTLPRQLKVKTRLRYLKNQ